MQSVAHTYARSPFVRHFTLQSICPLAVGEVFQKTLMAWHILLLSSRNYSTVHSPTIERIRIRILEISRNVDPQHLGINHAPNTAVMPGQRTKRAALARATSPPCHLSHRPTQPDAEHLEVDVDPSQRDRYCTALFREVDSTAYLKLARYSISHPTPQPPICVLMLQYRIRRAHLKPRSRRSNKSQLFISSMTRAPSSIQPHMDGMTRQHNRHNSKSPAHPAGGKKRVSMPAYATHSRSRLCRALPTPGARGSEAPPHPLVPRQRIYAIHKRASRTLARLASRASLPW